VVVDQIVLIRAGDKPAMGLLYPSFGILLGPEVAAISMAGSSFLVAVNALLLKRTRLEGIRRYGAADVGPAGAG
jgi:cation transport ATPase